MPLLEPSNSIFNHPTISNTESRQSDISVVMTVKYANVNTKRNQTSQAHVCIRQSKLSLDSFEADVIADRNAVMHGNIQRGMRPCSKPGSTGEFSSQGNHLIPLNTNMFPNEREPT